MIVFIKVLLVLAILPALVGWENPLLSDRQKGDVEFRAGKYADAVAHFEKAITAEGNDWKILYDLGTSYYHIGAWDKAIEKLTYAAKIAETEKVENLDQAHIHHNLGLSYLQNDDCENAVTSLEKASKLAPDDKDIAGNFAFAQNYCDNKSKAPNTEGDSRNKGSGDQKKDEKGQSQQGQSNDQSQSQSSASQGGDKQQNSGGQDDKSRQNGSGGTDQSKDNKGGDQKDQDRSTLDGQGGDQTQPTDVASDENSPKGQGKGDKENSENGNNSSSVAEGGNQSKSGDTGQGANGQGANDGLNLSNAQIQEILKYMSRLESDSAPEYFHNGPTEGDYLDQESMMDLLQRLFLGLPIDRKNPEPEDGIDW
jgi:Ca-activated chloride channel homolog